MKNRSVSLLIALVMLATWLVAGATPSARAAQLLPPPGKIFTGVAMGGELRDFTRRTGRRPAVWEQFVTWNQNYRWAIGRADQENVRLMLALSTAQSQDAPGVISPGDIAAGRGDEWLVSLRRDLGESGRPTYVRPLAEMNNCRNAYAPLNCNGSSRGPAYSPATFIKAWRRIAAIMQGQSGEQINAQLRKLHQPSLRASAGELLPAKIALVWSPMTGGSPMVSSLDPQRFWPGRSNVQWIGTSLYSKFPNFSWLASYYGRFSVRYKLPFMLAEWAMWGNDDPSFVRQLLGFTRSHARTRMLVYNQGKRSHGPFRLGQFPSAASTLKSGLTANLFQ